MPVNYVIIEKYLPLGVQHLAVDRMVGGVVADCHLLAGHKISFIGV